MRKPSAAMGTAVFLIVAPGGVAGLVPWMLTGWRSAAEVPVALRACGVVLVAGCAAVLVRAFVRFAVEGLGTPAPIAPTARLVVSGAYRYVRNPMYLALLGLIVGQSMWLARPVLLGYAAIVALAVVAFVRLYEQPTLRRTYGTQYDDYVRSVPGWIPSCRPRWAAQK